MHSLNEEKEINASQKKQHIAFDQIVMDKEVAQLDDSVSASFPNGGGPWSNRELNRIIRKLDGLDLDELQPIEFLEMLFYLSSGRSDARRLAEVTMDSYGSLAKIFARPGKELRDRFKLDHLMTAQIALARLTQKLLLVPDLACRKSILSAKDFLNYVASSMRGAEQEILRIIYLDRKFGIIKDQEMATGTVDAVAIYPREIAKQALAYCASSIILVHNHLSDDPTPSQSDILYTRKTKVALDALDIVLHDHLIISRSRYLSMCQEGFL